MLADQRMGLSPKGQRAYPAWHPAQGRLLCSREKSSLARGYHIGFAPCTEDRETVGRVIFLKTGREAFAALRLCPQLSTKQTCSPPGASFKG